MKNKKKSKYFIIHKKLLKIPNVLVVQSIIFMAYRPELRLKCS
jgi:hypothetical protein